MQTERKRRRDRYRGEIGRRGRVREKDKEDEKRERRRERDARDEKFVPVYCKRSIFQFLEEILDIISLGNNYFIKLNKSDVLSSHEYLHFSEIC